MKVASSAPMDTQRATGVVACATTPATKAQPGTLKSLANAVLARNRARNDSATGGREGAQPGGAEQGGGFSSTRADCGALEPFPRSEVEARRQRLIRVLVERPGVRYALETDTAPNSNAVIIALAIRGIGTCELRVSQGKFDPFLLLELMERHGGTMH